MKHLDPSSCAGGPRVPGLGVGASVVGLAAVLTALSATPAPAAPVGVTPWRWSGTIGVQTRFALTTEERSPWDTGPFAWGSNSRIELARGRARVSLASTRAVGFRDPTQPDRSYVLQLATPRFTIRTGDLDPKFTSGLTGFVRVAGTDARAGFGSHVQVNAVRGTSRRATPAVGPLAPSLAQRLSGERIVVKPRPTVSLGLSRIRMQEDAAVSGPAARDNLLVGSDLTWQLPGRRVHASVEYAVGMITQDRDAPRHDSVIPGDGGVARSFTRLGLARWMGFGSNDSTRAGDMLAARLAWTAREGRASLEYRRASRSFVSLALPYERSDVERVRLNGSTRLFASKAAVSTFVDWSRDNRSHSRLITGHSLSTSSSLTVTPRDGRRLTLSWRQSGRRNDATRTPESLWDPRIDSESRSLSLSDTRELRHGPGMEAGLTLSETRYDDRIRGGADSDALGVTFELRSLPAARRTFHLRLGHAISERSASPGQRTVTDFVLRAGTQGRRLQVHAGVNGSLVRDARGEEARAVTWTGGGGLPVDPHTRIEIEATASQRRDRVYAHLGAAARTIELRLQRTL